MPYSEVQIVVSSDWRRLFGDQALVALLGPSLGQRFIGVVNRYNDRERLKYLLKPLSASSAVGLRLMTIQVFLKRDETAMDVLSPVLLRPA